MRRSNDAPKRALNLSLKSKALEKDKELGMNVSRTVDELMAALVRGQDWGRWNEENQEAIDEYNTRIGREGLPLAKYRTF